MIKLYKGGVWYADGAVYETPEEIKKKTGLTTDTKSGRNKTIAAGILASHNTSGNSEDLQIRFDSLTSHDITYVGIIQTARASGMTKFPIPYVMTNCHNSLCAVGGTINEDDHKFALSAAHKYGGIFVPPNLAVIHSYNREMMSGCGRMILGSDSHTRYGALGTLAVGEGGGELAKQLVGRTYDMAAPKVIAVYLKGKPSFGVGPHDVALSIIGKTYENGYVKNAVIEFIGPGVFNLPIEYRNGIDVMTTETTCWSSIWETDSKTADYFEQHGRKEAFRELHPENGAYYDGCVEVDLSKIEPTIAMPMHPSYTYTIHEFLNNAADILHETQKRVNSQINKAAHLDLMSKLHSDGEVYVDQGIIAGCSGGTFDNICTAANILDGKDCGNGVFSLNVYAESMPTYLELMKNGSLAKLVSSGAVIRECFCGPCFGAGDTPANGELSIRHTTRNFPNREGSKPGEGQMAGVALMDARSIAATASRAGKLTAATDISYIDTVPHRFFDSSIYKKSVYNGYKKEEPEHPLVFGPNITDWPEMPKLSDDLLIKIVSYITDPVTTTDELIPSGETSSYRSNPLRLAEFTLSRKDPKYVGRAKEVAKLNEMRSESIPAEIAAIYEKLAENKIAAKPESTIIGSAVFANKPGDGSAREQAASCQRVLGAAANFALEYATKRYRSNCINWGIMPFLVKDSSLFKLGDYVFVSGIKKAILEKNDEISAYVVSGDEFTPVTLTIGALTDTERQILSDGSLINYYRSQL